MAPWWVADSDDKRRCRLNVIAHLLDQIPYERVPQPKVHLPERQARHGYTEPERPRHLVPARY